MLKAFSNSFSWIWFRKEVASLSPSVLFEMLFPESVLLKDPSSQTPGAQSEIILSERVQFRTFSRYTPQFWPEPLIPSPLILTASPCTRKTGSPGSAASITVSSGFPETEQIVRFRGTSTFSAYIPGYTRTVPPGLLLFTASEIERKSPPPLAFTAKVQGSAAACSYIRRASTLPCPNTGS